MDIQRTGRPQRRHRRAALAAAAGAGLVLLFVVAFSVAGRPPGVDAELAWSAEVKQAGFVHEVTAAGALFAPELRSVTVRSEGMVERVHVLPGHTVSPGDVLLELSSTTLGEDLLKARTALEAAEAEEQLRRAESEKEHLNLQATLSDVQSEYETAQFQSEAQQKLHKVQATSELEMRRSAAEVEQKKRRFEVAKTQLEHYPRTREAEDLVAAAKLAQQRRDVARLDEQVADLKVRAGLTGVVQTVEVEVGKRVSAGTEVARIVNAGNLLARVRVSERDAALVQVGQTARLELGRQMLTGSVTRVEPTVRDRLVTVDIALEGAGHKGLRPDLTVTARIEIDKVAETLVLDRPAGLRDDQESMEMFRLNASGDRATRVTVDIGRISARQVEIASGLKAGDRVILADMTEWLDEPEIRLR